MPAAPMRDLFKNDRIFECLEHTFAAALEDLVRVTFPDWLETVVLDRECDSKEERDPLLCLHAPSILSARRFSMCLLASLSVMW